MGYCLSMDIDVRKQKKESKDSTRFDHEVDQRMRQIDAAFLGIFGNLLSTSSEDNLVKIANEAFAAHRGSQILWDLHVQSSLGMPKRTLWQFKSTSKGLEEFQTPDSAYGYFCSTCFGVGYNPSKLKATDKVVPDFSGVTRSTQELEKIVPSSILKAEQRIYEVLDRLRGQGHFDEFMRSAEGAMSALGKEPQTYEILFPSRIFKNGQIFCAAHIYRLSLLPAQVIDRDGKNEWLSSEWEYRQRMKNAPVKPVAHFIPCEACGGLGAKGVGINY